MASRSKRVEFAWVRLWDRDAGVVAWNKERDIGEFEYEASFLKQGLEIAPLTMPLRSGIFSFPLLNRDTFHRLPGLLADALPDRFGNRIINTWLSQNGRSIEDFTSLELRPGTVLVYMFLGCQTDFMDVQGPDNP